MKKDVDLLMKVLMVSVWHMQCAAHTEENQPLVLHLCIHTEEFLENSTDIWQICQN